MSTVSLLRGDCLTLLDDLLTTPNASVDLIIVDPPYNISVENKITRKETTDIQMDFGEWDKFTPEEFIKFTNAWFEKCAKLLKEGGWFYVFFSNVKLGILEDCAKRYGILQRTLFTWVKTNPAPSYRKYTYRSATEPVWVGSKGKSRIPNFLSQQEMLNYKETSCRCNYGVTGHPTEKPTELIELFVKTSSNEGDLVLDPMIGSGTTGVVCKEFNRSFIGIERDPKWYKIAKERINNTECLVRKVGDGLLV